MMLQTMAAAQSVYELRQLSDRDWLNMSTEERMRALNISNSRAKDQTFVGHFVTNGDLYKKWGYDFYDLNDRYENYAFRGFTRYNILDDRRSLYYYNQFGDRITRLGSGTTLWRETYNDDGTASIGGPGGYINAHSGGRGGTGSVDGVWVARESTDDWAVAVVGSGALREQLTPLTMRLPNINGTAVDFQSQNWQARMVNSVMHNRYSGDETMIMLRGGQLHRQIGALTFGATISNMSANIRSREGGMNPKGHVGDINPTPMYYAVRVVDDSPQDGDGPVVHSIKLKVDGVVRPDIIPQAILDNLSRDRVNIMSQLPESDYLQPIPKSGSPAPEFTQPSVNMNIPKYLDYLYYNEYFTGTAIDTEWGKVFTSVDQANEFYSYVSPYNEIQVDGDQYVVYLYDLTSITTVVHQVSVDLTVSGDYRVEMGQILAVGTSGALGNKDTGGQSPSYYSATYWTTVAQAEGNIKDHSNTKTVTVNFGYEVANTIYGFDASFNYLGFRFSGEFVTNTHWYMYSDNVPGSGIPQNTGADITRRQGARSSYSDNAWYMTLQKDWEKFGFAGEIFRMGSLYNPAMMWWSLSNGIGDAAVTTNNFLRTTLIEDNDDGDAYPDLPFVARDMAAQITSLVDPDGVFPGNDIDGDSIPDNDKNLNKVPDYNEPFFMLDSDPDDFVFGDDFNNNNVPDFREDDLKDDTPYDLDRQGRNFYVRFTPQENVNLIAGAMRTRGVGADNRTDNKYIKANLTYDVLSIGNLFAEYRFERIQDNIQDKFLIVPTDAVISGGGQALTSKFLPDLYFDEVEYRNSNVNKLFVESKLRPLPALSIENHVRYIRNQQIEGTMYDSTYQPADVLSTVAMVNKLVYTRQWGNWTFSPGIKFRLYKKGRSESLNPLDHYMMRIPLAFLSYQVSPASRITFGFQGIPGFELVYKDYIQSQNDYRQVNYCFQLENRTSYLGFEIWGAFGFLLQDFKYEEPYRSFENLKSSTLFAQFWVGN